MQKNIAIYLEDFITKYVANTKKVGAISKSFGAGTLQGCCRVVTYFLRYVTYFTYFLIVWQKNNIIKKGCYEA